MVVVGVNFVEGVLYDCVSCILEGSVNLVEEVSEARGTNRVTCDVTTFSLLATMELESVKNVVK